MAKFCGHCGMQLEASDKVCGQCGQPVDGASALGSEPMAASQGKKKQTVKLVAASVAAVVVAVIAIIVILQGTGYKSLLSKTMKAYEACDVDAIIAMSSEAYYYSEWADQYFESVVTNSLKKFDSNLGYNYTISYKIDEVATMPQRAANELLMELYWSYAGFDANIIEEIVVAELTVTAKTSTKSMTQEISITMSKESGSWKLLAIE